MARVSGFEPVLLVMTIAFYQYEIYPYMLWQEPVGIEPTPSARPQLAYLQGYSNWIGIEPIGTAVAVAYQKAWLHIWYREKDSNLQQSFQSSLLSRINQKIYLLISRLPLAPLPF